MEVPPEPTEGAEAAAAIATEGSEAVAQGLSFLPVELQSTLAGQSQIIQNMALNQNMIAGLGPNVNLVLASIAQMHSLLPPNSISIAPPTPHDQEGDEPKKKKRKKARAPRHRAHRAPAPSAAPLACAGLQPTGWLHDGPQVRRRLP